MTKTKRNILLVLSLPPPYGGGEIRNAHLKKYFADQPGFHVLDISNPNSSKETQGVASLGNYLHGILIIFKFLGAYFKTRPKVIYIGLPKTFSAFLRNGMIIFLSRLLGTKILGDLAGMTFYFLEKSRWQRRIGLSLLRRVTVIKVLGDSLKDMLREKYALTNTLVMDNGVELAADRRPPRARSLTGKSLEVLHVGVLNQTKGIKSILQSVPALAARFPDIRFTFLGEWGDRGLESWVRQHIEEAGIARYVSFVGLVTGDAKWEYFARSDIYFHPSSLDGQPLSILEAMGMGLPVIASKAGAIPDTVIQGRNGILLDAVDSEHIVAAFGTLADTPGLYASMSQNNLHDFYKRFTLENFCRNIKHTLEQLRDE